MGFGSPWHWLIVLLVVVLIFGTKKLRNLGEDLGGAVKGFKKGMKDVHSDDPLPDNLTQRSEQDSAQTIDVQAKEKPEP